jgi:archaellum component FlaC
MCLYVTCLFLQNSASYFEAQLDDKVMQLIETKRKQTLLTSFSKLVNVLTNNLNQLKADIGTLKSDIGTLKSDIGQMKTDVNTNINQVKTEIITELKNILQQNLDQLIHRQIKTLLQDTVNNMS